MNNYINTKIYGLPVPTKVGHNTSPDKLRKDLEYIHKVTIYGNDYFKVHLKRQGISKIKYFSKLKEAKMFVDFLRENKYL